MSAPHRLTDQSSVLIRKAKALAKTIVDSCTEAEAARALAKMPNTNRHRRNRSNGAPKRSPKLTLSM